MTDTSLTAEIVTFRAAHGVAQDTLAEAASGLNAFLDGRDGFVSRTLSCDAEGTWTDYVIWTDLAKAKAAAEKIMAEPVAGAFMALVDPESVKMIHAPIHVRKAA